jgi:hypothetical protein
MIDCSMGICYRFSGRRRSKACRRLALAAPFDCVSLCSKVLIREILGMKNTKQTERRLNTCPDQPHWARSNSYSDAAGLSLYASKSPVTALALKLTGRDGRASRCSQKFKYESAGECLCAVFSSLKCRGVSTKKL